MTNSTFEIIVNDKTYVTKKMNPKRRGLVLRRIISNMTTQDDINLSMADVFENGLVDVIWEFLKDEDKSVIGTREILSDTVDDKSSMKFLQWCIAKVKELSDFLSETKPETQKV